MLDIANRGRMQDESWKYQEYKEDKSTLNKRKTTKTLDTAESRYLEPIKLVLIVRSSSY